MKSWELNESVDEVDQWEEVKVQEPPKVLKNEVEKVSLQISVSSEKKVNPKQNEKNEKKERKENNAVNIPLLKGLICCTITRALISVKQSVSTQIWSEFDQITGSYTWKVGSAFQEIDRLISIYESQIFPKISNLDEKYYKETHTELDIEFVYLKYFVSFLSKHGILANLCIIVSENSLSPTAADTKMPTKKRKFYETTDGKFKQRKKTKRYSENYSYQLTTISEKENESSCQKPIAIKYPTAWVEICENGKWQVINHCKAINQKQFLTNDFIISALKNSRSTYVISCGILQNEGKFIEYVDEISTGYCSDSDTINIERIKSTNDISLWLRSLMRAYTFKPLNAIENDHSKAIQKRREEIHKIELKYIPETHKEFKSNSCYLLEELTGHKYMPKKGAQPLQTLFKSTQKIFNRDDLLKLNTKNAWLKKGRAVIEGETETKRVRSGIGDILYFSKEQTKKKVPTLEKDGGLPRNANKNYEAFCKIFPEGTIQVCIDGAEQVCRKEMIEYAKILTSFQKVDNNKFIPVFEGILIHKSDVGKLMDSIEINKKKDAIKSEIEIQEASKSIWKKLMVMHMTKLYIAKLKEEK